MGSVANNTFEKVREQRSGLLKIDPESRIIDRLWGDDNDSYC